MWTDPEQFDPGEVVTAPDLNTQVIDNLTAIHDDGAGARIIVFADANEVAMPAVNIDAEVRRGVLPLAEVYAAGLKIQLRLMGSRRVATIGAGSNEILLQAASVDVNENAAPGFEDVTNIPSDSGDNTTETWYDTGWHDADISTGVDTADDLLVVRYTLTSNNTGQTSWARMTCLARIVEDV